MNESNSRIHIAYCRYNLEIDNACRMGNIDQVKRLLSPGIVLDSAFVASCMGGHLEIAKMLIAAGNMNGYQKVDIHYDQEGRFFVVLTVIWK